MNHEQSTQTSRPGLLTLALRYGVPLLVSVGLCWLLFRDVDMRSMWHVIVTECNFAWIAAALVVSVLSHVARAARWQLQLRALGIRPGLWALTLSIFGTYAVNLVLPRLGEVWRTGYIAKREQAPFGVVFGSMVADRLADTVMVAMLLLVTFLLAGSQLTAYLAQSGSEGSALSALLTSPWLWGGLALALALTAAAVWHWRHSAAVQRIAEMVRGLWQGFAVLATMPGKGRWLLLTLAIWGCYFLQLFLQFFAFRATADVVAQHGVLAVLVCFVFTSLSMGVPSNGGIGPWQWAMVFGLGLYAAGNPLLTETVRVTFANLVMGCQTLLLIALGIFTFACIALQRPSHNRL